MNQFPVKKKNEKAAKPKAFSSTIFFTDKKIIEIHNSHSGEKILEK